MPATRTLTTHGALCAAAVLVFAATAAAQSGTARYDNCSGQGYMTVGIKGEHMYPPNDPRSRSTPETLVTLYGDAASNFDWEAAMQHLRDNPREIGRHAYMWQYCGGWNLTYGPPNIVPSCDPCVQGNGSSGGGSAGGSGSSGGGVPDCATYLGVEVPPDHPMYTCDD